MNLTKNRKLIAIITTAVMCLAIVITASIIFAPNIYKNGDIDTSNTDINPYATYDQGGYGMESNVDFDMAVTYAVNGEDYVWIYYPRTIYMDSTESLDSLGYYFTYYCHYGNSGNTDYHHILFRAPMGYYKDKSGNNNSRYADATNNNANFDSFFNDYSISSNVVSGSNKNYNNNDAWTWESSQNGGDGAAYSIVYYEGGVFITNGSSVKTQMSMSGTGKVGSYTYNRLSNSPIFIARKYDSMFNPKVFKFALSSFADVSTATNSGRFPVDLSTSTPITQDISIKIEVYDKSTLLSAMKDLDNKYNALNGAGLLSQQARSDYSTFKTDVVNNYLKKREVSNSELNAKLTAVQNYVFNAYIPDPSLGTESAPKSYDYTGSAYTLANIWANYNSNIPNTNITYADCFPSGSMSYSATGFSGTSLPVTNKNNLVDAGYYKVTFTPSTATKSINVTYGGSTYAVKVKFTWANNSTTEKTGYLRIIPAEISLSGMTSALNMTYKGNTPNTLDGLPSGASITLVRADLNPAVVQLSTDYLDNNATAWEGVGNHLEFPDVTDEPVVVWYRVSATNHNSTNSYGTFTVSVNPADISIKLKHFEQLFHTQLLDSNAIFAQMIDASTPNILDATNYDETVAYLKNILTFAILKTDASGYFDPATDTPDAGSYTVSAIKTDDEDWAKRINLISFVDSSNSNCYQIKPQPIEVTWTDNANKWYDNTDGHRPSATIKDGQDTFGQTVGLSLVSVDGGEAVNADDYTANVASTNPNFTVSNNTYVFTVLPRKISLTIVDRTRTYAQALTADALVTQYEDDVLANNTNNGAYIAVLDSEIASVTGSDKAIIQDGIRYKEVFTVKVNAPRTPDGSYFVVGTHSLDITRVSDNYEFTTATNGKFIVDPARLEVTVNQIAPKVYNAESQDIVLPITTGDNGTVTALSGYELAHPDECITVQYSSTGVNGPWSDTPLQITNVIESPKTVYYKVSASNHIDYVSSFKQELRAVNIMVYFDGQTQEVHYGDPIPGSDELLNICGARFTVEERSVSGAEIAPEDLRDIHPAAIFDFYLLDPVTHQAIINRNTDAGTYTVSYRLKSTVAEREENFNVMFHLKDNGDRDNINAYEIKPKVLYVEWSQDGSRWSAGENSNGIKDNYTFSNSIPTVYPTAPNNTPSGDENVVPGDDIYLAGIELDGSRVNGVGYTVTTRLTKDRNMRNYYIETENASHTFYIIPLKIQIVIKDQTAKYGQAQQVPLGELIDPINAGALWDYAKGSENRFYADHYSNWKFVSQAHSADGSLVDVKYDTAGEIAGYDIGILANTGEGMDGTIRDNYDVEIVKEEGKNALFYIIPADIHFTGRQFNIDYETEDNVITKKMLTDRISTGLETRGVDISQFTVKMGDKVLKADTDSYDESTATWVEATTEVVDDMDCGMYHVLLVVEHNNGNFNKFTAKIELNILTDWISVKVGGGVDDAEYGYDVHTSAQIFDSLDFLSIAGFLTDNGAQLWDEDPDAAIAKLKQYVIMFVGSGDTVTAMSYNEAVGDYTIFMEDLNEDDEMYFRFVARDGESDTSNINAYHVHERTVSVIWDTDNMNEVYGEHGSSHTAYTISNIFEGDDESTVRFILEHKVAEGIEGNTASFDGGHAHTVGFYTAEVVSVTNPNYRLTTNASELICTFEITPKVLEISLHNRDFDYGTDSASVAGVDDALNVYSLVPNYDFDERTPFVGNDKRDDIFRIFLDGDKGELNYLNAGAYTINAEQRTDTAVAINYIINVRATGTLTVHEVDAGLSAHQLTTLQFNADEQTIVIDTNWIVLAGDTQYNRDNASIGFRLVSKENIREPEDTEFTPMGEYKLRDAGRYVLRVHIEAPNHNAFEADVNLNILSANVIINMTQTEKVYGDSLDKLLKDAHLPADATLSDWLMLKCNITITMYLDTGGGNRTEEDITQRAKNDFIFYVVDPNKLSGDGGDELETGSYQNNVGDYRVYHKMASGEIASNYSVEYAQEVGAASKCNAHAYKITPRPVEVEWSVTDSKDWDYNNPVFYYTGHTPGLVAQFKALDGENGEVPVSLLITGIDNVNANEPGQKYTARVSYDYWNSNQYALNYTLTRDSYEYTIAKRAITVTINNQEKGVYGTVFGNPELTQSNGVDGAYTVYDEVAKDYVANLEGNPLWLVLANTGIAADKFLPAGSYAIGVECRNPNYEVTPKGLKDGDDCGWLIVSKANFNLATTPYTYDKYRGVEFTLDFKQLFIDEHIVDQNAFVSGDDWQTAWERASITYIQDGVEVDRPVFAGAGVTTVEYTLTFDNYNDFTTGSFEVNVLKAVVKVSMTQVSSVYGDDLLTSAQIFANSNVTLVEDTIDIAIDEIITLFVDESTKYVGEYNIQFAYIDEQSANFTVSLEDNVNMYKIVPRVLEIIWTMDDSDSALDSDGAYIFDGKPHKIFADVSSRVLDGDVIEPKFEEISQKDQAKTYVARLIDIGTNPNYAMPEDCSFEWTIKPRPITVTWTVGDYTYDGNIKEPTAVIDADQVLLGTSCGLTVTGGEINAGTYDALASTTSTNYVVSNATQSFTIKPRQINVIWSDESFVYDGNEHAPTATIDESQLVGADADAVVNVTVSGAQINAGSYTATVSALDNSNYTVVGASKSFVIEKKTVTIHWTDTEFDYTGEVIAPSAKLEGVLNGDSVELEVSGGKSDVGNYTATATGVDNSNYALAPNAVTEMEFTINKVNNEFDGLYGIGDSKQEQVGIPWQGDNKPTDKFGGEVVIKYYDDEACTKEISVDKIKDGTYWAVAYVAGTDNYNELVSSPFKFTIDNGMNLALAICGIVISVVLLGGVLAVILIINKKKKGGNV